MRNTKAILIALLAAEISSTFEITMIYTAMPTLARTFGDTIGVGWALTACLLVSAVSAALCGRLGDLYGRRRVLLIALLLTATGSLTSAFAPSLRLFVVGAAIQGSSGALLPLCLALARENFPAERVPQYIGYIMAAASLGAGAGLIIGGFLIDTFGWKSIFLASATVALNGAILVRLFVPISPSQDSHHTALALLRGILFAPAIAALLLAVTQSRSWGWTDPRVVALFSTALLLFWYWGFNQLKAHHPLIDLRLMAQPQMLFAYLCMAFFGLGGMQHTLLMSMFFQQPVATLAGLGLTATAAGALLMPMRLTGIVASPLSGYMSTRYGPRVALLIGTATSLAGWAIVAAFNANLTLLMTGVLLEAAGGAIMVVAISSIVINGAPADRSGEAAGISVVLRTTFQAVGAQIVVWLLATSRIIPPGATTDYPTREAYLSVFLYIILVCVAGLIVASFLPSAKSRDP